MILIPLSLCLYALTCLSASPILNQDVRHNFGNNRFIAIAKSDIDEIASSILNSYDVDQMGHSTSEVHLKLPEIAVDTLIEKDIPFKDHTDTFLDNIERNLQSRDFVCLDGTEECANLPSFRFYNSYHTLDTIHKRFENIASELGSITRLEDFGTTYENRTSKILWFENRSRKQPIIFYYCAIHPREWITPLFCTYMAEKLSDVDNLETQELLSNFTFAIVPVANPDGYVYSFEEDNTWRKTRKPDTESSRCVGVDANRNFEVGFGGPGSSRNPCSDTYRGLEAFDQPCTETIKNFVEEYKDRIVHINDVHSYGEYFLSPFAGKRDYPSDSNKHEQCSEDVSTAIQQESGLVFKTGTFARALYVASGVSNDYFYSLGITHSYTFEARGGGRTGISGFQPPVSNIMPSNRELYAGMVALVRCVHAQEILNISVPEITCEDEVNDCIALDCSTSKRNSCARTCKDCDKQSGPGLTIIDDSNSTLLVVILIVFSMIIVNMAIYITYLGRKVEFLKVSAINVQPRRITLTNTSLGLDHYGL